MRESRIVPLSRGSAMATRVHSTALVDRAAQLGDNVEVGPWSVVEACTIGDGSVLGANVVVKAGVQLGQGVRVGASALIGVPPTDFALEYLLARSMSVPGKGRHESVYIGDKTTIREFATICAGTEYQTDPGKTDIGFGGATVIGSSCYIMTYVIVGPGCHVGDRAVVVSASHLGANAEIGEAARISGLVVIDPGIRVGRIAMVSGCSRVSADVPPFTLAYGSPARVYGVNRPGLKKEGVPPEVVSDIKRAFRLIFQDGLDPRTAVARARTELSPSAIASAHDLLDFVEVGTSDLATPDGIWRRQL
jgi:UDP-N-acetylglucosamine acyltransferase